MLEIIATLIPIFAIMLVGALVERLRVLPANAGACLNSFVYCVSLPLMIFTSMASIKVEDIPYNSALSFLIGLFLTQAVAHVAFRLMGESHENASMGSLISTFPNSGYMGLPIVALLFPDSPEAMMNVTIMIILPTFILVYTDTFVTLCKKNSLSFVQTVKNITKTIFTNLMLLGFFLGTFVAFSGIQIPDSLFYAAKMLGSTAAPCALFCMGMSLTIQITQNIRQMRERKSTSAQASSSHDGQCAHDGQGTHGKQDTWHFGRQAYITFHKLVLMPLVVFALAYGFGVRGISLTVITLVSAMPSAIVVTVLSAKHEVMVADGSMALVINTLVSAFTLFIAISLLQSFV